MKPLTFVRNPLKETHYLRVLLIFFLRVTVNRLKERVGRESTPTKRLTVTPTKPILSVPVINQPKRLILTPTKRLLSVPLTNLPKRQIFFNITLGQGQISSIFIGGGQEGSISG